jgi:hypothetical protein
MSKYVAAIYDRVLADATNKTAKGLFNVSDWLRINNNTGVVEVLVEALLGISIPNTSLTPPVNGTWVTISPLNSLITNIENIRLASGLPAITGLVELKDDWLAGSSADAPDYTDVNDWERVLDLIFTYVPKVADYRIHCGVCTVGEPRFWQNRFIRNQWVQDSATPVRRVRMNVGLCGAGLMRQNGFRRY